VVSGVRPFDFGFWIADLGFKKIKRQKTGNLRIQELRNSGIKELKN
jgi:hypothetical protein